jgi:hypothetical protein
MIVSCADDKTLKVSVLRMRERERENARSTPECVSMNLPQVMVCGKWSSQGHVRGPS